MEAVLPFEVEVPSLRILAESGLKESEWAQKRYDQLNLIEGNRLTAMSHGCLYQQRMKNAFDKKVRLRKFHEGDLVLKKMSHAVKENVLTLVLNFALICDHLSPAAQFIGCPKRLIKIEPKPTFTKICCV